MPNTTLPEAPSSAESWAEVRAHDRVMRYRRTGTGRPVVVLHSSDDGGDLWPELLETLSGSYRLIIPEAPPADADVARWLADFLEGLGTSSVRIVASGRLAMAALELALLEAVAIPRLVLVVEGPPAADAPRGFVRSGFGRASVPMLILRRGHDATDGVTAIADFLRQEMASPA